MGSCPLPLVSRTCPRITLLGEAPSDLCPSRAPSQTKGQMDNRNESGTDLPPPGNPRAPSSKPSLTTCSALPSAPLHPPPYTFAGCPLPPTVCSPSSHLLPPLPRPCFPKSPKSHLGSDAFEPKRPQSWSVCPASGSAGSALCVHRHLLPQAQDGPGACVQAHLWRTQLTEPGSGPNRGPGSRGLWPSVLG